ncbi:helix-turn-helix domain-containing protein [Salipaludibacillus sp. CF4.18]|uniref:helix-turn-helix domain-containing protein n=1 Tax=Salipaludibacillus sp. CF4.18 TaxID=3373081 RepID=UPI003EE48834
MFGLLGLGKRRSAFGELLDAKGITQREFAKKSKIHEDTLTRMCNEDKYEPSSKVYRKAQRGLDKLGLNEDITDYFN